MRGRSTLSFATRVARCRRRSHGEKRNGLAIHFAATFGATKMVELLLRKAPSTISFTDSNCKCTPLGVAAFGGQASTVSSLLSAGAREPMVWTPGTIHDNALILAVELNRQNVVRILLDQGLEAIGGVAMIPEAMRNSILRGFIGILRMLLNVQGEDRQGFWANHAVFSEMELTTADFPSGTPLCRVKAVLTAEVGIPLLHIAAGCCSLRATHVVLSSGADVAAVDFEGDRACDIVGDFREGEKRDAARENSLRRMLQRGPAFRSLSWTWSAVTGPVDVAPGTALKATSLVRRASTVRIFQARGRRCFIARCTRYGSDFGHEWGRLLVP